MSAYAPSPPDHTCERCGETYRVTGETAEKQAAVFQTWVCPCTPKPVIDSLFEPDADMRALSALIAVTFVAWVALIVAAVWFGVAR